MRCPCCSPSWRFTLPCAGTARPKTSIATACSFSSSFSSSWARACICKCLLTVPGILILVFSDLLKGRSTSVQASVVIGLTVFPFLCIISPIEVTVALVLALLASLLLLRPAWRHPAFWLCAIGMIALGYSTYAMLYIRSGLNPFIDMNNPETYENFKAFLTRQQYGVHSIFPRRGDFWDFQFNIHVKYFLQQFPFYDQGLIGRFFSETLPGFTERFSVGEMLSGSFRRAVANLDGNRETIAYSVVPILLGIVGAVSHFRRDWKRFASVFAMFLLMGLGLVLYLNMPDPEPREREYIFVGAYAFFGLWIGGGAAALIVAVTRGHAAVPAAALAAVVCLIVPIGLLQNNYFERDRSGDLVARDYARNILSSCEPDAIIFTNGDNDTYPLWYLQYVEGFRRDVRVVNLSLLKTPWYVKQLRDLDPMLPIPMTDATIDRAGHCPPLADTIRHPARRQHDYRQGRRHPPHGIPGGRPAHGCPGIPHLHDLVPG